MKITYTKEVDWEDSYGETAQEQEVAEMHFVEQADGRQKVRLVMANGDFKTLRFETKYSLTKN